MAGPEDAVSTCELHSASESPPARVHLGALVQGVGLTQSVHPCRHLALARTPGDAQRDLVGEDLPLLS